MTTVKYPDRISGMCFYCLHRITRDGRGHAENCTINREGTGDEVALNVVPADQGKVIRSQQQTLDQLYVASRRVVTVYDDDSKQGTLGEWFAQLEEAVSALRELVVDP